jgi:hypothetical protein
MIPSVVEWSCCCCSCSVRSVCVRILWFVLGWFRWRRGGARDIEKKKKSMSRETNTCLNNNFLGIQICGGTFLNCHWLPQKEEGSTPVTFWILRWHGSLIVSHRTVQKLGNTPVVPQLRLQSSLFPASVSQHQLSLSIVAGAPLDIYNKIYLLKQPGRLLLDVVLPSTLFMRGDTHSCYYRCFLQPFYFSICNEN